MNLAIRKKYNFYWRFYLDRRDEESCGNRFLVASGVNDIKAGRRKVFPATTATVSSIACLHIKSVGLEQQLD